MKRRLAVILCALLTAIFCVGMAEEAPARALILPGTLTEIGAQAFMNDTSIAEVVLPETLTEIGARAFFGCTGLGSVLVPSSVERIGEEAFDANTVILAASAEDYAARWAGENGYVWRVAGERRYFALIVGQTYPEDGVASLPGCENDASSMVKMLGTMGATPYRVTRRANLTADGILASIREAFAGASADDLCLFYYSGHGVTGTGALVGAGESWSMVTMAELRAALDQVPGTRVVILDSCYSGNALPGMRSRNGGGTVTATELDASARAVIAAFARKSAEGPEDTYYVLASSSAEETSTALSMANGVSFSAFTWALLMGSGYDEMEGAFTGALKADTDGNGQITMTEAGVYAQRETAELLTMVGQTQHVQIYPSGSALVLWGR